MKKYKIIALIGESASGKDTILKAICNENNPFIHPIVSYTTRPPREGEVYGKDYYFITANEFANLILEEKMLEATVFREWCYGTGIDSLDENKINIGVFNPDGIELLSHLDNIDLFVYWLVATPKTRLLRSLNREANPDVDEIVRRYETDNDDFNKLTFGIRLIRIWNETDDDLMEVKQTIIADAVDLYNKSLDKTD